MIDDHALVGAGIALFCMFATVAGIWWRKRKKLKPLPRPNRVPYDSKTFRK